MAKNNFIRLKNRLFHRVLGRALFQGEDFYSKPSLRKVLIRHCNQFLNEKGCQTPFVFTNEECLDFWKSMDNANASIGNRPNVYAGKENDIVDFLRNFWTPEVSKQDSILELGCNCGANLFWLKSMGYEKLSGTEINPNAIKQMTESFPSLTDCVKVSIGEIGEILKKMKDGAVDVIFTMGVSMHIHPSKNIIFREMTRVASKYVCTIEPEAANANYVFARNYRRVFEGLGSRQLKSALVGKLRSRGLDDYGDCVLRLFDVSLIRRMG